MPRPQSVWSELSPLLRPYFPFPLVFLRKLTHADGRPLFTEGLVLAFILNWYTIVWNPEEDEHGAPIIRAYQRFRGEVLTTSGPYLARVFGLKPRSIRHILNHLESAGLIGRNVVTVQRERGRIQKRYIQVWPEIDTLRELFGGAESLEDRPLTPPQGFSSSVAKTPSPGLVPLTSSYVKATARLNLQDAEAIPIPLRLMRLFRDWKVPNWTLSLMLYAYTLYKVRPNPDIPEGLPAFTTTWTDLLDLFRRTKRQLYRTIQALEDRGLLRLQGQEDAVTLEPNLLQLLGALKEEEIGDFPLAVEEETLSASGNQQVMTQVFSLCGVPKKYHEPLLSALQQGKLRPADFLFELARCYRDTHNGLVHSPGAAAEASIIKGNRPAQDTRSPDFLRRHLPEQVIEVLEQHWEQLGLPPDPYSHLFE